MTVRRSLGAGVAWMAFGVRAEALAPAMDVGLAPAAGHDLSTAADAELGPSADAKVDLAEDLEQGEEQSSGSKIWHNHKRSELLADAYMFKVVCIFNLRYVARTLFFAATRYFRLLSVNPAHRTAPFLGGQAIGTRVP
ncbi:unnamed protein product [Prorocentrum cordatum]|uniref:Uncharacterized protein n=1 Tax=Prorocentrum cordatum TaxID=2364126 RepID=A0ABN9WN83_9DINO|nr:unnamed protein product [Polarella glacialis]